MAATWRRSSKGAEVHVLIDRARVARCGAPAGELGAPLAEDGQVGQLICDGCVSALLHDANDTEAVLADLVSDRARAPKDDHTHMFEVGRAALGSLIQTVPLGSTTKLLTQAADLLERDPEQAYKNVRTWRANMRAIGVLPLQDPSN